MAYTFISYSLQDRDFVDRLAADLQAAGVVTWYDSAQIVAGQNWNREIDRALSQAGAIIFVVSRASIKSERMRQEITTASKRSTPLYSVLIDDLAATAIPRFIFSHPWFDFRQDYQAVLRALLTALPLSVRSEIPLPVEPELIEPKKAKGYVFISYAEPDSEFVTRVRSFLAEKGYAFWDYQSSDRNYHTAQFLELEEAITGAAATLSILSPD